MTICCDAQQHLKRLCYSIYIRARYMSQYSDVWPKYNGRGKKAINIINVSVCWLGHAADSLNIVVHTYLFCLVCRDTDWYRQCWCCVAAATGLFPIIALSNTESSSVEFHISFTQHTSSFFSIFLLFQSPTPRSFYKLRSREEKTFFGHIPFKKLANVPIPKFTA